MNQVWHIFKKDVRYLRIEICVMLAASVLSAWSESRLEPSQTDSAMTVVPLPLPLIMLMLFIIARAIHAETIPGDNQFWLTRPYRSSQLLAEKVFFILVFVNAPALIAQAFIIHAAQFPVLSNWSGLLWTQLLLFICLALPAAAIAAITSGLVSFVLSIVGSLVVMALFARALASNRGLGETLVPPFQVEWVRNNAIVGLLLVCAAVILFLQYRHRNTLSSRIFALVAAMLSLVAYLALPVEVELAAQTHILKEPTGAASIALVMDPSRKLEVSAHTSPSNSVTDSAWIKLPVNLTGVPEGNDTLIDAVSFAFEAGGGQTWQIGPSAPQEHWESGEAIPSDIFMDSSFFNSKHDVPLTIRATVYFTLFGNTQEQTFVPDGSPKNLTPQLQCRSLADYVDGHLVCRTAFRNPRQLLYARVRNEMHPLRLRISYSPFPATFSLDPLQDTLLTFSGQPVTIVMKEPLAHIRRDFELRNVRLDDFLTAK